MENEFQTKLNKMLAPDENGMVSAKHLYELLGLNPSNYSKWCKSNFFTDFGLIDGAKPSNGAFVPKYERIDTEVETANKLLEQMNTELEKIGVGAQPNPSQDYLITIRIANKICLKSKSEHKDEIVEYFLDLEEAMPKAALTVQEQSKAIQFLTEQVNELRTFVESKFDEVYKLSTNNAARLACYESGAVLGMDHDEAWLNEMEENIKKLADAWPGINGDLKKCLDRIIDRIEYKDLFRRPFQEYINDFKRHNPGVKAYRLTVIAAYEDLRDSFEYVLYELMETYGLKKRVDICEFFPVEDATIDYSEDNYYHSRIMTDEECEEAYNGIEFMKKLYGEPQ